MKTCTECKFNRVCKAWDNFYMAYLNGSMEMSNGEFVGFNIEGNIETLLAKECFYYTGKDKD